MRESRRRARWGFPAEPAFASYSYVAATFRGTVQIATLDTNPEPAQPGDVFASSPLHRARAGLGIDRAAGDVLWGGELDVQGVSSQYLRGDEANRHPPLPGYAVAGFRGHFSWNHYGLELGVENLFDRRYYTFGIIAHNTLAGGDDDEDRPSTS